MSDQGQKRKKSKGWYRKQAFLNKRMKTGHRLAAGQRGFIVTCNDREKDAVREAYNILNEYADKRYGPEEIQNKREVESDSDADSDGDIEKAIAAEVQTLKAAAQTERRFQNCQTGAKNCIFIKTTIPDPAGLAYDIFSDLLQTKKQKSRYALRLLPVVGTCKGNLKSIETLAEEVLAPFFQDTKFEITYTIMFKARNNNGVGRELVISALRQIITEKFANVLARFCPANPQLTILVEVMCGVACIAIVRKFVEFRKYNLIEVVSEKSQQPEVTDDQNKDKTGGSSHSGPASETQTGSVESKTHTGCAETKQQTEPEANMGEGCEQLSRDSNSVQKESDEGENDGGSADTKQQQTKNGTNLGEGCEELNRDSGIEQKESDDGKKENDSGKTVSAGVVDGSDQQQFEEKKVCETADTGNAELTSDAS